MFETRALNVIRRNSSRLSASGFSDHLCTSSARSRYDHPERSVTLSSRSSTVRALTIRLRDSPFSPAAGDRSKRFTSKACSVPTTSTLVSGVSIPHCFASSSMPPSTGAFDHRSFRSGNLAIQSVPSSRRITVFGRAPPTELPGRSRSSSSASIGSSDSMAAAAWRSRARSWMLGNRPPAGSCGSGVCPKLSAPMRPSAG